MYFPAERREKEARKEEKLERTKLKRGHSPEDTGSGKDGYRDEWEAGSGASSTASHRSHHHTPEVSPRYADERGSSYGSTFLGF